MGDRSTFGSLDRLRYIRCFFSTWTRAVQQLSMGVTLFSMMVWIFHPAELTPEFCTHYSHNVMKNYMWNRHLHMSVHTRTKQRGKFSARVCMSVWVVCWRQPANQQSETACSSFIPSLNNHFQMLLALQHEGRCFVSEPERHCWKNPVSVPNNSNQHGPNYDCSHSMKRWCFFLLWGWSGSRLYSDRKQTGKCDRKNSVHV